VRISRPSADIDIGFRKACISVANKKEPRLALFVGTDDTE
jgi:hypothetical protein